MVTNPGNTPLDNVAIGDDRCGPVEPVLDGGDNVGDDNGDGRLDPGEEWEYTCTQPVLSEQNRPRPADGTSSTTPRSRGTDPTGELVTATASDDVDVFTPHITLAKTANGVEVANDDEGDPVTYEYVVTNAGNTPLGTVTLSDEPPRAPTPTCRRRQRRHGPRRRRGLDVRVRHHRDRGRRQHRERDRGPAEPARRERTVRGAQPAGHRPGPRPGRCRQRGHRPDQVGHPDNVLLDPVPTRPRSR